MGCLGFQAGTPSNGLKNRSFLTLSNLSKGSVVSMAHNITKCSFHSGPLGIRQDRMRGASDIQDEMR